MESVSQIGEDQVEAERDAGKALRQAVYACAMRMLAAREHSVQELTRKLTAKGHLQTLVQEVVEALRQQGLQSNERFAEVFVRSRVNRGYGPIRIRRDLAQRGIDDDLIDAELTCTAERWIDLARSARDKRFCETQPGDRDGWNRQARFLARRGFPADLIYRVLGQL